MASEIRNLKPSRAQQTCITCKQIGNQNVEGPYVLKGFVSAPGVVAEPTLLLQAFVAEGPRTLNPRAFGSRFNSAGDWTANLAKSMR